MMRMPSKSIPSSAAFTLVELLMVIGIIAMLLAILVPALSWARAMARNVRCAANLRTLGQVLVLHANDHEGYMPLAGNIAPGRTTLGPDDPASLGDPSRLRYDYYSNDPATVCVTAMPAALSSYFATRAREDSWQNVDTDIQARGPLQEAFTCPADQKTIDRTYGAPLWIVNQGSQTFLNGWSSYGFNSEVFGWTDTGVGGTTGHSRIRGKLSIIPHPSDTMLMCDCNASIEIWVLGPQLSLGDVYLGTGGTSGNQVFDLTRHHGAMNILFADGHADSHLILSSGTTQAAGDIGTPANAPSGDLMSVSMDRDFR